MAVLAVCLVTLSYPLHGDVRHEIGVQAVSGHSAASTFSHRPLYRLLVSVLAWPADLVTTSTRSFELVLRVEAVGVTFVACIYFLRNPTDCRFPSPVFLQRSRYEHDHEGSRSWAETLGCIRDSPGQWLVREVSWFRLTSQPPEVIDVLTATFDCHRAVKVDGFLVCPRRF